MPRKPLDDRILDLISRGIENNHRSFIVLVGDRAKAHNQIVNLHFLLAQKQTTRPNVLFCYKKELGFTTNRKVRQEKIKRDVKRGIRDQNDMDPFELFVSVTDIRYTYYKDTHKILGQTFGMLVLQDFEAITPNILARTIETVKGGGLVVLILQGMRNLRQLYSMSMDVHDRYRTESSEDPVPRFNERFILSLGNNLGCLVVDDELNILPISQTDRVKPESKPNRQSEDLAKVKESLKDVVPTGPVVNEAKTVDQAKALLLFSEAITDRRASSMVALTAGRGRGKSAALGLALALAIANSYANIYVTSPSPENLGTLFEFLFKGLDQLGYKEHLHYDVVQSTSTAWKGAVVRVNLFRNHRQTIQYIRPEDSQVLGQAELLVIDEAAAIPLPLVRALLGPYLVFMSSTVSGYEGTGRSLSLKLLQQLRKAATEPSVQGGKDPVRKDVKVFRETNLEEPIRYGRDDPVEAWLNQLLCLDTKIGSSLTSKNPQGCPHPSTCELYYVERDTLFSFHPASEAFLQRMMGLYVSSHYKNSPNDLQLMSDAPAHNLFVLLPPIKEDGSLPEPLVVLQIALEGRISREAIRKSLSRGLQPGGDLIPWTLSQQFQDDEFASLSGGRVVRIATHPDYASMGYGSRALQILKDFYTGKLLNLDESAQVPRFESFKDASLKNSDANLQSESITIRDVSKMPALLQRLSDRRPEPLDYLGVSFGLTSQLFKFWKRCGYAPLYLRQTQNELTGEHTCIMLTNLENNDTKPWLHSFADDFRQRFLALISFPCFADLRSITALSFLDALPPPKSTAATSQEIRTMLTPFDLKRLSAYGNNLLDYHVIVDLLPRIGLLFFSGRLPPDFDLSGVQKSILLALSLQRKSIEAIEAELNLPVNQILALLVKIIRKVATLFTQLSADEQAPSAGEKPLAEDMDVDEAPPDRPKKKKRKERA